MEEKKDAGAGGFALVNPKRAQAARSGDVPYRHAPAADFDRLDVEACDSNEGKRTGRKTLQVTRTDSFYRSDDFAELQPIQYGRLSWRRIILMSCFPRRDEIASEHRCRRGPA